jgi:Large ribosomal RNA subunit accumulation protein YceD
MKQPAVEFSRPLQVDRIPNLGSHDRLAADERECTALAVRLGLPKLYSLSGFLKSTPWRGGGLKITGPLKADFEQTSVVSLENFRSSLEVEVERYFLPAHKGLNSSEEDVDIIENGIVDLGEILAETMALELDPYPRKPGEVFSDIQEDVEPNKISPFTGLSKLKPASADRKK